MGGADHQVERVTLYRGVLVPLLQRVDLVRKVAFNGTPLSTITPAPVRAQHDHGDDGDIRLTPSPNLFVAILRVDRMMFADRFESSTPISDKALRKQIDRSVSRALVDSTYAAQLLSDPTLALGDHGCPPQQFKSLRSIQALNLVDFAQQVHALFWMPEPTPSSLEAQAPLPAAASN